LSDAAVAFAGTPALPATFTVTGVLATRAPRRADAAAPGRVSTSRLGVIGV